METAEQFGAALSARRAEAGDPSYKTIERELWRRLGALVPTAETIRRYHAGKVEPEKADVLLVSALADVYNCRVADISEAVEAHRRMVLDLLARSRCALPSPTSDGVGTSRLALLPVASPRVLATTTR